MLLLDPLKLELEKNALIEASAGTGKTYTITTLFTRLVAQGFTIDSILVVTFTEAAAAELKYRIRQRLAAALSFLEENGSFDNKKNNSIDDKENDELYLYLNQGSKKDIAEKILRIRQGLICFDEAAIMTIHSFCFRILRENAFETGALFNVKLIPDTKPIVREIVLDFISVEVNDLNPIFLKFLKKKNFKVNNLVSLFTRVMSRSGVKIIPDPDHVKFCDVSDDYIKICRELLKILELEEEEIKEIFLNHPGVNRKSYSRKSVEKWLKTAKSDLFKFHTYISESGKSKSGQPPDIDAEPELEEYTGHIFNMTEKGDSLYKFTNSRLKGKNKENSPVPRHLFFDLCEKLFEITQVFQSNITALKINFCKFVIKELEIRKERLGICFFDDIVNALADALKSKNAKMLVSKIREKFSSVLIDEFQDTDQRQYSIFSMVFSGTNTPFFMIGDPKQAIYAFRGGDIFAYLRAVEDAQGRAYTLEKNWRSDPLLVNAVNSIFMKSDNPFLFNEIKFNPVTTPETSENRFMKNGELYPPFQFLFVSGKTGEQDKKGFIKKDWLNKNIPLMVADDIASLLNSDASIKIKAEQDPQITSVDMTTSESAVSDDSTSYNKQISPGDIAILVRTNIQAESISCALSSAGIPSYISKTGSVFDSNEAIEMADLLAAVLEPEKSDFMSAALCSGIFGLSYMDICLLNYDHSENSINYRNSLHYCNSDEQCKPGHSCESGKIPGTDKTDKTDKIYKSCRTDDLEHSYNFNNISISQWHENFKNWKYLWEQKGIIRTLQDIFYLKHAMSTNLNERSLTNYYHLAELLHRAECEKYLSAFALYKWFLNQLVPDMREEYSDELRLETDAGAINIVTIHKSKGMEYPVVYLPYLWEGVVHGEKDDNPVFHNPDDNNKETIDLGSETIDESRQYAVFEEEAENMRILYVGLTRAASMCRIIWGNFKSIEKSALFKLIHQKKDSLEEFMLEDIRRLAEQSCGAISIESYEKIETHKTHILYNYKDEKNEELVCRIFPFNIVQQWMFTSFSRLSSGYTEPAVIPEMPFNDEKQNQKISLIDFPKGPIPGELIHSVFEYIDFMADTSLIKETVRSKLVQYGFDPLKWTDLIADVFSEILTTPLYNESMKINHHGKQENFLLKDINKDQRLNEMEFIFPFESFSKRMLANIFRNHMNNKKTASIYADKLLDLEFNAVRGFMKGFIDLVFKFKGKWYIIDYKSNYLGDTYSDYSEPAMVLSMMEHHYFLQYHLYVTAIHRYLGFRIKDYDYKSHFGGVFYLFVRGMHPDSGSDFGVFYDRPDYEMVKQLSELF